MFNVQPTGALPGVVIIGSITEGLTVRANGKPAQLAVVDAEGHVLAFGEQVAREAEAVAVNAYRNLIERGQFFEPAISHAIPFVMPPEEGPES
jgi:hypothetical protein